MVVHLVLEEKTQRFLMVLNVNELFLNEDGSRFINYIILTLVILLVSYLILSSVALQTI